MAKSRLDRAIDAIVEAEVNEAWSEGWAKGYVEGGDHTIEWAIMILKDEYPGAVSLIESNSAYWGY